MSGEHGQLHEQLEERITKLEQEKGLIRSGLGKMLSKFQSKQFEQENSITALQNEVAELKQQLSEVKPIVSGTTEEREDGKINRVVELVKSSFDRTELIELCADFGIDYEDLTGENRVEKIRKLVTYFQRRNKLNMFIEWCQGLRPKVKWPLTETVNVGNDAP